jgi:nicotinate-nucleotide pyrophosphorylase (carboxylating)
MQPLSSEEIQRAVGVALAEDMGGGDVTSLAVVPKEASARAIMVAREPMVVAGLAVAEEVFHQVCNETQIEHVVKDGAVVPKGAALLKVSGPAQSILTSERVALNFVQRLCGVATLTAQFVEAIKDTNAKILDTRKTTPGLRLLEKYAVTCGGGLNHRIGLFDRVLIKDNHLAVLRGQKPNPIAVAVSRARQRYPQLQVEVEADNLEQVAQALDAGADFILFDNMESEELRAAVKLVAGNAKTEASGGITLANARRLARTGVDFLSVGALTHSARAMDVALDFLD